ncbi:hypothetical protein RB213_003185, partial [Colletotrichum asianum]
MVEHIRSWLNTSKSFKYKFTSTWDLDTENAILSMILAPSSCSQ